MFFCYVLLLFYLVIPSAAAPPPEVCDSQLGLLEEEYEDLAGQLRDHAATGHTVMLSSSKDSSQIRDQSYKARHRRLTLDLTALNRVLDVNVTQNSVRVQAKVTMDELVQATLAHGRVPAVIPEFKSITVAGAIVGGALESSSFRYGQFSDTVLECLVLLANGTIVNVSETSHPDLYHALPGSYGTLGIVLEATLHLIEVPSNGLVTVTVTAAESNYHDPTQRKKQDIRALTDLTTMPQTQQKYQYIDALHFPNGRLVTISGQFIHSSTTTTSDTKRQPQEMASSHSDIPHMEMKPRGLWFYEQIQDRLLHHNGTATSPCLFHFTMSIYDYLFRYDYGAFWMARPLQFSWAGLAREPHLVGPFLVASRYTRAIFGPLYTTQKLYRMLHQLDAHAVAEKFVFVDAYLPASNASEYLHFLQQHIPTSTPIWICPVKRPSRPQPLSPSGRNTHDVTEEPMLLNVALWGRVQDGRGIDYVSAVEDEVIRLNGRKMLYSQSIRMTADQLYQNHVDGDTYHHLRQRYDPRGVFPSLHEKLQIPYNRTSSNRLHYRISRMLL